MKSGARPDRRSLTMTTDRKLGKTTPDWVRELAGRPL